MPQVSNHIMVPFDPANVNMTGTPTAPTASSGNSSTQVATTAFVNNQINLQVVAEPGVAVPTTGQTVTVTPTSLIYIQTIDPTGALLNLTVNIAAGTVAGQICRVSFSQAITLGLTWGTTISPTVGLNLPSTVTGSQALNFTWSATVSKWILS